MVKTIQARNISLYDLETKFNLTVVENGNFFIEWRDNLPAITEEEKQSLNRVRRNYLNLSRRHPMLEDLVKMVVVSPLLDLANFYSRDFAIRTEAEVEISLEDEGETIKGYIDILVLKENFWVLVIESKRTQVDVVSALPQALFYMLYNSNLNRETFGLITNGREFVFIKLNQDDSPKYARSDALSIEREQEFYSILSILKNLGKLEAN
jgi:hypothetical protein